MLERRCLNLHSPHVFLTLSEIPQHRFLFIAPRSISVSFDRHGRNPPKCPGHASQFRDHATSGIDGHLTKLLIRLQPATTTPRLLSPRRSIAQTGQRPCIGILGLDASSSRLGAMQRLRTSASGWVFGTEAFVVSERKSCVCRSQFGGARSNEPGGQSCPSWPGQDLLRALVFSFSLLIWVLFLFPGFGN